MEPESYQPYPWTQFAPQLPSPGEFAILVLYTGALILAGKLFKSWWTRNNETVPIPVALGMGISMIFMFLLLIVAFYNRSVSSQEIIKVVMEDGREMNAITPDSRYFGLLLWCMIAFVFPLFYYGLIIVNSFASRVIDRVSPFGMQIHEPSEFAEARKLALRGDVDGAVKRYRAYLENTEDALFEAARLLKAEDRFAEAAALFQEISERFYGKKLIWAEATYHLAKLRESHLHQATKATTLFEHIIERTPDTRFGQLAQTELARMSHLYGTTTDAPTEKIDIAPLDDPFYDDEDARRPLTVEPLGAEDNGRHHAPESDDNEDEEDLPVPSADPFYAVAQRNREEAARLELEAQEADAPKPAKKTVARKKPAAKKKAAAKKTPAKRNTKPKI